RRRARGGRPVHRGADSQPRGRRRRRGQRGRTERSNAAAARRQRHGRRGHAGRARDFHRSGGHIGGGGRDVPRPRAGAWRTKVKRVVLALVIAAALLPALARAQAVTGTILGSITDTTGAVMPGTTVTLTNTGTGLTRTVVTDGNGEYTVPSLPTG